MKVFMKRNCEGIYHGPLVNLGPRSASPFFKDERYWALCPVLLIGKVLKIRILFLSLY
jgi:hypothetical protein